MRRNLVIVLSLALAAVACKKQEEHKAAPPPAEPTPTAAAPAEPPPAPEPAAPAATPSGDSVKFIGSHQPAKDGDPVVVTPAGVKVVKADFKDPKDLTGGTAELEIDLTTLTSGNTTRDEDLMKKYFEVDKFGKATVVVKDVKKGKAEGSYTASADVDVHGVKKTLPVEFQVTEVLPDGVKVKGSHKLNRLDFKVGTPNGEGGNPTANDVTVELELTVKKSA